MLIPPADELQQGDIVAQLFFPIIGGLSFDFLSRKNDDVKIVLGVSPDSAPPDHPKALAPVIQQPAIIASQTCDIGGSRREFVLAIPLLPIGDRIKPSEIPQLGKQEKHLGYFPILSNAELKVEEPLLADFRRITSFQIADAADWTYLEQHRLAALTRDARAVFQNKLSNWFGRYAAPDDWMQEGSST